MTWSVMAMVLRRSSATVRAMEGQEDLLASLSYVAERVKEARIANAAGQAQSVETVLRQAARKVRQEQFRQSRRWRAEYWAPYQGR